MTRQLPADPRGRMGIYKQLDDVPEHHRLRQYSTEYDGRDVWETFLTEYLFERYNSERFKQKVHRAGRRWKTHIEGRGRHHALATPRDVERWSEKLLDRLGMRTVYNSYWIQIERFYSWLQYHTEHPHCYQPVLMAAADYPSSKRIWEHKLSRGESND